MAFPILALAAATSAFAVTVGDSFDKVIQEKGQPAGIITAGPVRILTYADAVIKVRDDAVVSVKVPDKQAEVAASPAVAAAPKPAPAPESYDGPAVWETDFGQALGQARARKCHIMIVYTGSDWCPWCKKMDAEVYSQPEFARYSHEKFVLLKLDYLRHSPMSDAAKAQNTDMLQRYHVNGYPNLVIVDMNGKALGRFTGYYEGGPEHFIRMVQAYE
jgi:thiol:disulfide interchange protein